MEKKDEKKKNSSKAAKVKNNTKTTSKVEEEKVAAVKIVKEENKKSTSKANSHFLFKILAICILVAVVFTWVIPAGSFSSGTFTSGELERKGIADIFLNIFYASNHYLLQVVFVLIVGLFYGVLAKTDGYKALINKATEFWIDKKTRFVLIHTLLIALFASTATQSFPTLIFIPMIISIASRLGFGKISSIAMTFGAIMIGTVGQTTSLVGINYLVSTMGIEVGTNLLARFGILAFGYLLLNLLIIKNMKKDKAEEELDLIPLTGNENKGKAWPYIVLFSVLLVVAVLGFMPWSSVFDITIFDTFHTWITEKATITIGGTSHAVLSYILGTTSTFGEWDLYTYAYVSMIALVFVKLFSKIKFDEALDGAVEGMKKLVKPALFVVLAYTMFEFCYSQYSTGFVNTIVNGIVGEKFNVFSNTFANIIADFFHVDFGYTAFVFGSVFASRFKDYVATILVIMTSVNGLVSMVAPTSVVLLTGLSMYDASYKKWLKYIWKLALVLLVILVAFFLVLA